MRRLSLARLIMLLGTLLLIWSVGLMLPVGAADGGGEDEDCLPCSVSKAPDGYYTSAVGPVLLAGPRVWSPDSMVIANASNLVPSAWGWILQAAARRGDTTITPTGLMTGDYIIVQLHLYSQPPLAPESVEVVTANGSKPQPLLSIPSLPAPPGMYGGILVYAPEDLVAEDIPWWQVELKYGATRMRFTLKSPS